MLALCGTQLLQQYLSDNIETTQKRALQFIFRGASYSETLSNVGL